MIICLKKVKIFRMKKGAAIPVRLDEDEKKQLAAIAAETGLTSSTLIRLLIASLTSYWRDSGHTITLPLKWQNLLAQKSIDQ